MSGLVPSTPKSTIFFCNVPDHVRLDILNIMPIVEGSLPVKYLGVPLIASRFIFKDCKVLVEKMEGRITNWKNKMLSFVGRLQLIGSVLSVLYIYWASVFILPKRVIADLEAKMRGFLWSQGAVSQGKAKVSWKSVCLPKHEGGLGIRRIGDMNTALMSHHIWSILSKRKSLWVDWIYSYKLSNCHFWESDAALGPPSRHNKWVFLDSLHMVSRAQIGFWTVPGTEYKPQRPNQVQFHPGTGYG
ncbi:hypothetical protein QVD17_39384 [Tagetes erecta]|uniref:Reverse transcriptase n=1 Tax=Tagetes erecta TaxID=13708 RepID=A0AAD8JQG9_TARER|nr:hypothetical protein QVD17_39384 [Tagetes erecta]